MRYAGLFGDPVEHSLSPVMHNAAFRALGIDGTYALWHVAAGDLPGRLEELRAEEFFGANVTVPHKELTRTLVDEVTKAAARIGAVNTVINQSGRLVGDNTDAYGVARTLDGVVIAGHRVVVLGAGGASRAVLVALQDLGAAEIVLVNRTVSRAKQLAQDLALDGAVPITAVGFDDLEAKARGARLLVNATSVGWHGEELPCSVEVLDTLDTDAAVLDLTYRQTALLRAAAARDGRALDGLPMLLHQGARAFTLWTGVEAPVEVMARALDEERARRSSA